MDNFTITYRITLADESTEVFDFNLNGSPSKLPADSNEEAPYWTELSYRQCSHCPLSTDEHKHCPVALQLHNVVSRLHDTKSIDTVALEVITEDRTVSQKTAIQRIIASMLELIYPTSGCPKTLWMKPLARFHTPLSSEEETVFRIASMYLLAQHFVKQNSDDSDLALDGLATIYQDMHILNTAVASRLQTATQSDSVKNAVTLLDMYSILIPILMEDNLVEMRSFFSAYLPETEASESSTSYLKEAKAYSLDFELEPLDTETPEQAMHLPSWLKSAQPAATNSGRVIAAEEKTPFITSSGLSLELAPIDDFADSTSNVGHTTDLRGSSGKARFILPDD